MPTMTVRDRGICTYMYTVQVQEFPSAVATLTASCGVSCELRLAQSPNSLSCLSVSIIGQIQADQMKNTTLTVSISRHGPDERG